MLRPLLLLALAALTLLSGCMTMTREGRRDMTWDQGGYADPEGATFIGYHGPLNRRAEKPGS
jgi:hypothetical protein